MMENGDREKDPLQFIQENFGLYEFAFEDYVHNLPDSDEIEALLFMVRGTGKILLGYDNTHVLVQEKLPQQFCLFSHLVTHTPEEIFYAWRGKTFYAKIYPTPYQALSFMIFIVGAPRADLATIRATADDLMQVFEGLHCS